MVSDGKADRAAYLGPSHVLASVAARHCRAQHPVPTSSRLGRVACGRCWEEVIRADERVAVEHNLPPIDPAEAAAYLDEVAITRACRGERVELTRPERREAVRRLHARGCGLGTIANRLNMNEAQIRVVLDAGGSGPKAEAA
jgi:non-ribosomal peptide synthetase component F